jgi:hypothetical protein
MDFRAEVERGDHDNLLLPSVIMGENPITPDMEALDKLDEEFTPSDLLDEDRGWIQSSSANTVFTMNLPSTWKFLHYCYLFRGPVKNVTNNLSMLTGTPDFEFEKDTDESTWKEIAEFNKMDLRQGRNVRNTYLFNDYYSIVFDEESKSMPKIRNLEPYFISDLKTDPDDVENVLQYVDTKGNKHEGDHVVRHTVDQIGNDKRGAPLFLAAMREINYLYKHLLDVYLLQHMRARFPIIRKVTGGLRGVLAEQDRMQYLPGAGRILVETKGGDWMYPPEWRGSKGAREIYEMYLTSIASAMNLPYFLVSGDYRNNSLASTLTANDPTVRLIRWYRKQIAAQHIQIIKICLRNPDLEVKANWEPVLDRDKKKEAEAYAIGVEKGAVSARTMCEDVFGKTWDGEDGEAKRIRDELHEDMLGGKPAALPPPPPGGNDKGKKKILIPGR